MINKKNLIIIDLSIILNINTNKITNNVIGIKIILINIIKKFWFLK